MNIARVETGPVTGGLHAMEPTTRRTAGNPDTSVRARVGDRVELSIAAQALAKQYSANGLTPDRIRQIRTQVESGVRSSPSFAESLAWRLIEAGIV